MGRADVSPRNPTGRPLGRHGSSGRAEGRCSKSASSPTWPCRGRGCSPLRAEPGSSGQSREGGPERRDSLCDVARSPRGSPRCAAPRPWGSLRFRRNVDESNEDAGSRCGEASGSGRAAEREPVTDRRGSRYCKAGLLPAQRDGRVWGQRSNFVKMIFKSHFASSGTSGVFSPVTKMNKKFMFGVGRRCRFC